MRSILRDPGAEVVVGLLGFAGSFIAIGIALTALSVTHRTLACYSYVAYGVAALFFLVAVIAGITLFLHLAKTKGYVRQIGIYLTEGRALRGELLLVRTIPEWTEEMKAKVPHWKARVQRWLDENLPEHAPGFDVEGFLVDLDTPDGVNGEASRAAQHLESRMSNLKEIMRETRR